MRKRLWAFLICLALWPGVAHAAWWGFLQELSGPGPFWGLGDSVRVLCVRDTSPGSEITTCLRGTDPDTIRQVVNVQYGVQWSGGERFGDVAGDADRVFAFRLEPTYHFRVHPALDIGPGVGLLRLSGSGFAPLYRLSVTPISLAFTPGRLDGGTSTRSGLVRIRFDELYLPVGFSGADFGNAVTTYATSHEWLSSVTVDIDLWGLHR